MDSFVRGVILPNSKTMVVLLDILLSRHDNLLCDAWIVTVHVMRLLSPMMKSYLGAIELRDLVIISINFIRLVEVLFKCLQR
jgi:hypothetical protein